MPVEAESLAPLTGRVEVVEPNRVTGWVRAPADTAHRVTLHANGAELLSTTAAPVMTTDGEAAVARP
jgi:hypothetical protein